MKNLLIFLVLALVCETAFSDVIISKTFKFDGKEIKKDDPLLLSYEDPIAFSTALAEGNPVSLKITAEDENAIVNTAILYWDDSGEEVEGMFCWDYNDDEYYSFSYHEQYLLKETIVTDLKTNIFTRAIMLVPEPAGFLLLTFIATVVWHNVRNRVKSIIY